LVNKTKPREKKKLSPFFKGSCSNAAPAP